MPPTTTRKVIAAGLAGAVVAAWLAAVVLLKPRPAASSANSIAAAREPAETAARDLASAAPIKAPEAPTPAPVPGGSADAATGFEAKLRAVLTPGEIRFDETSMKD